jgi:hypothetical protein
VSGNVIWFDDFLIRDLAIYSTLLPSSTENMPDEVNIWRVWTPAKAAKLADYRSTECDPPHIIISEPGLVRAITDAKFAIAAVGKNIAASLLNNWLSLSSNVMFVTSSRF